MNPSITDPNKIYAGQSLNLPPSPPTSTPGTNALPPSLAVASPSPGTSPYSGSVQPSSGPIVSDPSKLNAVGLNLRLGGSAGVAGGSFGPSLEFGNNALGGSFNGSGQLGEPSVGVKMSLDVGFSFTNNNNPGVSNDFKYTAKLTTTRTVNILGNGFYQKTEVDLSSGDRTYKFGISLGASGESPVSSKSAIQYGFKGTSSTPYKEFTKPGAFRIRGGMFGSQSDL